MEIAVSPRHASGSRTARPCSRTPARGARAWRTGRARSHVRWRVQHEADGVRPDSTAASTRSSSRSPQILMRVRVCGASEPIPFQFTETSRDDGTVLLHGKEEQRRIGLNWKRNQRHGSTNCSGKLMLAIVPNSSEIQSVRREGRCRQLCGRVGRSVDAQPATLAGGRFRCRPARRRCCGSCDAGRRRHENRSAAPRRAAARRPNGWS